MPYSFIFFHSFIHSFNEYTEYLLGSRYSTRSTTECLLIPSFLQDRKLREHAPYPHCALVFTGCRTHPAQCVGQCAALLYSTLWGPASLRSRHAIWSANPTQQLTQEGSFCPPFGWRLPCSPWISNLGLHNPQLFLSPWASGGSCWTKGSLVTPPSTLAWVAGVRSLSHRHQGALPWSPRNDSGAPRNDTMFAKLQMGVAS